MTLEHPHKRVAVVGYKESTLHPEIPQRIPRPIGLQAIKKTDKI